VSHAVTIDLQDPLRAEALKTPGRAFHNASGNKIITLAIVVKVFIERGHNQARAEFNDCTVFVEARVAVRQAQDVTEKTVKVCL
jgi:hypothetical protein